LSLTHFLWCRYNTNLNASSKEFVHGEFQIAFKNQPAVALCNIVTPRYSTSLSANSVIRHRQALICWYWVVRNLCKHQILSRFSQRYQKLRKIQSCAERVPCLLVSYNRPAVGRSVSDRLPSVLLVSSIQWPFTQSNLCPHSWLDESVTPPSKPPLDRRCWPGARGCSSPKL